MTHLVGGPTTCLTLALAMFSALPGKASDAPLQHALRAARCLPSSVKQVAKHSHVTVFEARCAAPVARVVRFSCDGASCRADEPEDNEPL